MFEVPTPWCPFQFDPVDVGLLSSRGVAPLPCFVEAGALALAEGRVTPHAGVCGSWCHPGSTHDAVGDSSLPRLIDVISTWNYDQTECLQGHLMVKGGVGNRV